MKIAIAGFGVEGRANLSYFRAKFPDAEFAILDEKQPQNIPENVAVITGENAFSRANDFDLIIRSPGIAPDKFAPIPDQENHSKITEKMHGKAKKMPKIWSSTNEFLLEAKKRGILTIGVTGSKGKGTTASFIAAILRAHFMKTSGEKKQNPANNENSLRNINRKSSNSNREIFLLGNIGQPALEILPQIPNNSIVVYEMSSFQLWDAESSPEIAVLTMIEPDHLDVHKDFADYVAAKNNITKFQTAENLLIFNAADKNCEKIAKKSKAHKIPFLNKKFVHVEQGEFYFAAEKIAKTDIVKLPGEHNIRNAAAAISATWEIIQGEKNAIKKGVAEFAGLPHRLKFVAEKSGVKYYDDSIATTPGSAIAAIKSFSGKKQILILGGKDKGGDYAKLGEEIAQSGDVKIIIAIGENRAKVAREIAQKSDVKIIEIDAKNMAEIVAIAAQNSEKGDIVIMTPAAASFDMFASYQDRGEKFIAAVENLK